MNKLFRQPGVPAEVQVLVDSRVKLGLLSLGEDHRTESSAASCLLLGGSVKTKPNVVFPDRYETVLFTWTLSWTLLWQWAILTCTQWVFLLL
jgi:hypothetical protein